MIRRLFRVSVKLGIIAGAIGIAVVIGKKLMGGLGPEPGSDLAPKEWPSLVPEPTVAAGTNGNNGNGATPAADATTDAGEGAEATTD